MRLFTPRRAVAVLAYVAMGFATVGMHIVHPFFHAPCQCQTVACRHDDHGCASLAHGPRLRGPHSAGRRQNASPRNEDVAWGQRLHRTSTCPICQLLAGTFKMACRAASSDGLAGLSAMPKVHSLPRLTCANAASPLTFRSRAPPYPPVVPEQFLTNNT